jgi:hypothetical protein
MLYYYIPISHLFVHLGFCFLLGLPLGHALRRLVVGFPPRRPGFEPRSDHVGFAVEKAALGQVFSYYLGLPCQ